MLDVYMMSAVSFGATAALRSASASTLTAEAPAFKLSQDAMPEALSPRIAVLAEQCKMIRKTEKTVGIHDNTSVSSVNHIAGLPARLIRVSRYKFCRSEIRV